MKSRHIRLIKGYWQVALWRTEGYPPHFILPIGNKKAETRRPARGKRKINYPLKISAFGVGTRRVRVPRVARSSQPWALGRNPFGIRFRLSALGSRLSQAFRP